MNFRGPSQKNILSNISVLQSKALHFHYFILKLPCFLQFLVNRTCQLFYCYINSIPFLIRIVERRQFWWYSNSRLFNTHKFFLFHKFRLLLHNFRHYLMCSIDANHYEMRQHRKGRFHHQLKYSSSLEKLGTPFLGKRCCKEVLGLTSYKLKMLQMCCCDNGILSKKDAEEKKVAW